MSHDRQVQTQTNIDKMLPIPDVDGRVGGFVMRRMRNTRVT